MLLFSAECVLEDRFLDRNLGVEMIESPAWFKEILWRSIGAITTRQGRGQLEDTEKDGKWRSVRVVLKSGEWSVSLEDRLFT